MLSSAEGSDEASALQVMSPSAPATQELQRAEATYGSVAGLPNGVARQGTEVSMSDSGQTVARVSPSGPGEVVAVLEDPGAGAGQVVVPGQAAVGGQATVAATMALGDGSVHAMRADMDVQQGSSLTVVRWISRLNDFLANQGQSVLGSVGFNTTPTQGPRHSRTTQPALTPAATPTRSQQAAAASGGSRSMQGSPLMVSPPEELPQGRPGWSHQTEQPGHETPLFSREAWEHMMRFSHRAPWLYGRGEQSQGESTAGSSEVQAEVQRQMDAMMRAQSYQLQEMREEIGLLRAERARLMADQASLGAPSHRVGDDGPQRSGDPCGGLHVIAESEEGRQHQWTS